MSLDPKECDLPNCTGTAYFHDHCGAWVCSECGKHRNFVRCWCGWALSGGDGYQELKDMGENLEGV